MDNIFVPGYAVWCLWTHIPPKSYLK